MHLKPNEADHPNLQDLRSQAIVLEYVLEAFPQRLTVPGLVSELTHDGSSFAESDAFERAVRDLTGVGLLHCPGGVVEPTRAALRFHELTEG